MAKNRGFRFISEKSDQVLIGFEEGSLARSIVIGSLFHGKNGQGGGDKVKIMGQECLLLKSKLQCGGGGNISFINNGQI